MIGETVYSVSGNRLDIMDAQDPSQPRRIGALELNRFSGAAAATVAARSGVVFLTGGGPSLGNYPALTAVDVSNLAVPVLLDSSTESGGADVALSGTLALVPSFADGLRIYDVSLPSDIRLMATLQLSGSVTRVVATTDRAFVLNPGPILTLTVVDIADPNAPRVLGSKQVPTELTSGYGYFGSDGYVGLTVAGGRAYLGSKNGVIVVDVSDPAAQRVLGRIGPTDLVTGIAAIGTRLVVGSLSSIYTLRIS